MNTRKPLVLALLLITSALLLPNIMPTSLAQGVPTDPDLYHFDMVSGPTPPPFPEPYVGASFIGLWPHPIQGYLYELECLIDENDNGEADVCEQIALRDLDTGEKLWFHVEYITVTINVTLLSIPTEWHAMEFNGTKEEFNAIIDFDPTDTQWHEVKPNFCEWWHIKNVTLDTAPTGLSYCDNMWMYTKYVNGTQKDPEVEVHVEWARTNIICSLEEWIPSTLVAAQFNGTTTTGTYFEIIPKRDIQAYQCEDIEIQINVNNAFATYAWQLKLSWNNTVLKIIDVTYGDFLTYPPMIFNITTPLDVAQAQGWVGIGSTYTGTVAVPPSGSGWLCNVTFHVIQDGRSWLNLFDTSVLSPGKVSTEVPNNDGFFCSEAAKPCLHDVYVDSIVISPSNVTEGDSVLITVTVNNEGQHDQTVEVDLFASLVVHNPLDPDIVMISQADLLVTLGPMPLNMSISQTEYYTWSTNLVPAEDWIISARVRKTDGEVDDDPHDNILIDGIVRITAPDHDLKVICPITVPSYVFARDTANITFTVRNQGPAAEDFDVTITATNATSTYPVGTVSITGLGSWQVATRTYSWDTDPTVWARGTYTITVTAEDKGEKTEDLWDQSCTANITIRPVYSRVLTALVAAPPPPLEKVYWVSEKILVRITVRNDGTEVDQWNITLYAEHLKCFINGSSYVTTPVLQPGQIATFYMEWDTLGTWVEPLGAWQIYLPLYKIVNWTIRYGPRAGQKTSWAVRSEVNGGSWAMVALAEIHPEERPEDRADNRVEGLPIIIGQLAADCNLDGAVGTPDKIITGKLLGDSRP